MAPNPQRPELEVTPADCRGLKLSESRGREENPPPPALLPGLNCAAGHTPALPFSALEKQNSDFRRQPVSSGTFLL